MFYYCISLPKIDLSNFNTQNVINISSMFYGCISLSNINLSNLSNIKNINNKNCIFDDCFSLLI